MKKTVFLGLLVVLLALGFIGCDNGNGGNDPIHTVTAEFLEIYTVSFDSNGGSSVFPITGITPGSTVTLPQNPIKGFNDFIGWFTDNDTFLNEFTSSTPVTQNITVFAKWYSSTSLSGQVYAFNDDEWDYEPYSGDPLTVEGRSYNNHSIGGSGNISAFGQLHFSITVNPQILYSIEEAVQELLSSSGEGWRVHSFYENNGLTISNETVSALSLYGMEVLDVNGVIHKRSVSVNEDVYVEVFYIYVESDVTFTATGGQNDWYTLPHLNLVLKTGWNAVCYEFDYRNNSFSITLNDPIDTFFLHTW